MIFRILERSEDARLISSINSINSFIAVKAFE